MAKKVSVPKGFATGAKAAVKGRTKFKGQDGLESWVEDGKLVMNKEYDKLGRQIPRGAKSTDDGVMVSDMHNGTPAKEINGRLYLYPDTSVNRDRNGALGYSAKQFRDEYVRAKYAMEDPDVSAFERAFMRKKQKK